MLSSRKTLWDKIANAVSALATHKSSADHDGRYYTESEINTKLGGKSDTSHNHDSSYVKKHTVAEVSGIQVGKKETNGYGWIDIYYKGVHEFSIYVENSGTGLIIKPALPLSTRHQYVNVLCQLQQKGNLVVDSGRIVDNCTSDVTYNVLSANQGRILMNKYNQLNSEKVAKSENPLYFRGTITGSLNRTNISPGYYTIGAIGSVSGTHHDSKTCWCLFIQFGDSYKTQMILDSGGPHTRSYIGSPSAWTNWTTNTLA